MRSFIFISTLICQGILGSLAHCQNFSTAKTQQKLQTYIVSFKQAAIGSNKNVFQNKRLFSQQRQLIKSQHQRFLNKLEGHFGSSFATSQRLVYAYSIAINAISLRLKDDEAAYLASLDEVLQVSKQGYLHTATDAAASMVNADELWSGVAIAPLNGVKGEDIVVAIIDTGINMGHESFSDAPEDAYDFASHNPFGSGNFKGWCDPTNPDFDASLICNNKLIGAWDFADQFGNEADGPVDSNFHGSSMSGIISGNNITAPVGGFVFSFNGDILNAPFISGIAPHAHIIVYDVCDNVIGCPTAAILAAIDQAILDGAHIINLALDGGDAPWDNNSVALALLNANNLGIVTSTAAGNATSALPATIGRVNNLAPWVITAANSLHGRTQSNDVSVTSPIPVPNFLLDMYSLLAAGISMIADINAPVIYARDIDVNNEDGCLAWNPLDFDTAVALLKTGNCSAESKVQNAEDAGAVAVIIFNDAADVPMQLTGINSPTIPAVMIGLTDANNMIAFIQANTPTNTLLQILAESSHRIVDALGMVLYHSSLRGPNIQFGVSKPDISAPGTDIFAAIAELGEPAPQYFTATGTSQSSAVISGSLALLKNVHPDWTASELKSALMLTAQDNMLHEDGTTTNTDDIGAGMMDVALAVNTVLVMDETFNNYLNANPAIGGLPENLNLPSMRNNDCNISCTWSRTFTNKGSVTRPWMLTTATDNNSEITLSANSFT
ncbi:MAG TPA: hypothetical protein ENJ41_03705, partial [Oceanospirillales bacterium]|nr:hypothetical protein [Oceanospirillales bacterium]